jgi:hypothetical protein
VWPNCPEKKHYHSDILIVLLSVSVLIRLAAVRCRYESSPDSTQRQVFQITLARAVDSPDAEHVKANGIIFMSALLAVSSSVSIH